MCLFVHIIPSTRPSMHPSILFCFQFRVIGGVHPGVYRRACVRINMYLNELTVHMYIVTNWLIFLPDWLPVFFIFGVQISPGYFESSAKHVSSSVTGTTDYFYFQLVKMFLTGDFYGNWLFFSERYNWGVFAHMWRTKTIFGWQEKVLQIFSSPSTWHFVILLSKSRIRQNGGENMEFVFKHSEFLEVAVMSHALSVKLFPSFIQAPRTSLLQSEPRWAPKMWFSRRFARTSRWAGWVFSVKLEPWVFSWKDFPDWKELTVMFIHDCQLKCCHTTKLHSLIFINEKLHFQDFSFSFASSSSFSFQLCTSTLLFLF